MCGLLNKMLRKTDWNVKNLGVKMTSHGDFSSDDMSVLLVLIYGNQTFFLPSPIRQLKIFFFLYMCA